MTVPLGRLASCQLAANFVSPVDLEMTLDDPKPPPPFPSWQSLEHLSDTRGVPLLNMKYLTFYINILKIPFGWQHIFTNFNRICVVN